jgi:phosphate uptake regulator
MFSQIWKMLQSSETLLDEAWRDSSAMLVHCRQMYDRVIPNLAHPDGNQIVSHIAHMDRELNEQQREVRKKVFEHLAFSRGSNVESGLQLASIVIDLERIGDYTKNISELNGMLPQPLSFGEYQDRVTRLHELVSQLFDLTEESFNLRSADRARRAMRLYPQISKLCDKTLRQVIAGNTTADSDCSIERSHLGLVLLLRYLKRVAAHLKNVCTAFVNPFHQFGFRDGLD